MADEELVALRSVAEAARAFLRSTVQSAKGYQYDTMAALDDALLQWQRAPTAESQRDKTESEHEALKRNAALALDAARKEALEDALRWVDAIHEGKDGSRDPAVVDNTCSRIKHTIRALIDKPPAPPADGKAVAAAMNEVAKRGLRGRHDG